MRRLVEEIAIVQPKIVVVMGEPALRVLNRLEVPLSRQIEAREGEIQAFTPTIDALYTPDIDESLDEEGAKQRFWRSFKIARRVVRGPAAVLRVRPAGIALDCSRNRLRWPAALRVHDAAPIRRSLATRSFWRPQGRRLRLPRSSPRCALARPRTTTVSSAV